MCGENMIYLGVILDEAGSPPHVWGKLFGKVLRRPVTRITPTCVGKVPTFYDYIITDNCDLVNAINDTRRCPTLCLTY